MLKRRLQYLSVLVVVIAAIAEVDINGCRKLPADGYATIMSCCKESPIMYYEEVMVSCRFFNSSTEIIHNDLILMNVCETHCYLKHYDVIDDNGTVHVDKLLDFLTMHLPEEHHAPLADYIDICMPKVEFLKDFRIYPPTCHWYYAFIIDCIQGLLFVNCPDSERDSSEVCNDSRAYVHHCGIIGLREAFDHNGLRLNETSVSEDSSSYYESDESSGSYSKSSEYET